MQLEGVEVDASLAILRMGVERHYRCSAEGGVRKVVGLSTVLHIVPVKISMALIGLRVTYTQPRSMVDVFVALYGRFRLIQRPAVEELQDRNKRLLDVRILVLTVRILAVIGYILGVVIQHHPYEEVEGVALKRVAVLAGTAYAGLRMRFVGAEVLEVRDAIGVAKPHNTVPVGFIDAFNGAETV